MTNSKNAKELFKKKYVKFDKSLLIVQYGINRSYFSITGSLGEKLGRGERYNDPMYDENRVIYENVAGGCIHDIIINHCPEFKDFITMHLSDAVTGEPLYALENGWYHLNNNGFDMVQKYLRLNDDNLSRLKDYLDTKGNDKITFAAFIDTMRPTWKKEAHNLIEQFELSE